MKNLNRIILFVLILLLIGLVALRATRGNLSSFRPLVIQFQAALTLSPDAQAAPEPTADLTPDPAPTPSPEPTPEPTPAPVSRIDLEEGEEIDWDCGIPFRDPGFTAYGRNGEELTEAVVTTGTVIPWHPGEYTLTYTLRDSGGVIDTVTRTVHVVPQKMAEPVKPESGTICLTFIDTPCECTEELLTLLKRDEVKATFFVSTHQEGYLDLITKIAEDGHELGIYLPNMSWYAGEDGVLEHSLSEIVKMQEIIYERTGRYAKFIRFYGGTINASYLAIQFPGGYEELYETMHEMGLLVFDWNLEVDVSEITHKVSSNFTHPTEPYEYVVAMQQNFHRYSVLAVPEMIRWAKEKEYTLSVLKTTYPEVLLGQDEWKPPSPDPTSSPKPGTVSSRSDAVSEDEKAAALEAALAAVEAQIDALSSEAARQ